MGAMVAYLRIPSIVVTLGILSILKGGLISATGGAWINELPDGFHLAQMKPFGIADAGLSHGDPDRCRRAAGCAIRPPAARSTPSAATPRRRGFPASTASARCLKVFAIHGFFAGLAALLYATQLAIIQSTVPTNLELTIITASVVGGVTILGGTGTVIGSTLAAILIAAIGSSLIFINVSPYWLRAVQGVLILLDGARRSVAPRPPGPEAVKP